MNKSEFDAKAREWDADPARLKRSEAIAECLLTMIPVSSEMKVLEYGAGTGILSFILSEYVSEIILMDSSREMVNVMHEKIKSGTLKKNLKPLYFNLEESDYLSDKFNLIITQMVLHHIINVEDILLKFYSLLDPGGYLAIADLYAEDGSFHGSGFAGHNGFDVRVLQSTMEGIGFNHIRTETCFRISKIIDEKTLEYPVFLMIVQK